MDLYRGGSNARLGKSNKKQKKGKPVDKPGEPINWPAEPIHASPLCSSYLVCGGQREGLGGEGGCGAG